MFDVKEMKEKIQNGGIAVDEALEQRILNDELTERDHAFLSRVFGTMRQLKKGELPSNMDNPIA